MKANRSEKVSAPSERQKVRQEIKDWRKAGRPTINPSTGGAMKKGGSVKKKK